jgi:Uma2 family endonuclease
MATAAIRRTTEENYLATERVAGTKSEYFDGELFAMAGESFAHNQITGNIYGILWNQLKKAECKPLLSDMRIQIPPKRKFTYADMLVVCGKPEFAPGPPDNLLNPRVIVEVLSPSTELYDRTIKFRHYQEIESFTEYLLVEQDEPLIDRFSRGEDGQWTLTSAVGMEALLPLRSIPCELHLAEVYRDVAFPQVPMRTPTPVEPSV